MTESRAVAWGIAGLAVATPAAGLIARVSPWFALLLLVTLFCVWRSGVELRKERA